MYREERGQKERGVYTEERGQAERGGSKEECTERKKGRSVTSPHFSFSLLLINDEEVTLFIMFFFILHSFLLGCVYLCVCNLQHIDWHEPERCNQVEAVI